MKISERIKSLATRERAAFRKRLIKARAARKAKLSPIQSGRMGIITPSRAARHQGLDIKALRKRRAKNRVARASRQANRSHK